VIVLFSSFGIGVGKAMTIDCGWRLLGFCWLISSRGTCFCIGGLSGRRNRGWCRGLCGNVRLVEATTLVIVGGYLQALAYRRGPNVKYCALLRIFKWLSQLTE